MRAAWLLALAAIATGVAGWATSGAALSGPANPMQPDLPAFGVAGDGPAEWSGATPGLLQLAVVRDVIESTPVPAQRGAVIVAVVLIAWFATAVAWRRRPDGGGTSLALGWLAGVAAVLGFAMPWVWEATAGRVSVVAGALVMAWFVVATRPGKSDPLTRIAATLALLVGLALQPAHVIAVPAAWAWRRAFAEPHAVAMQRDLLRLIELVIAGLAVLVIGNAALQAGLAGRWPVNPTLLLHPLTIGVGVVAVVLTIAGLRSTSWSVPLLVTGLGILLGLATLRGVAFTTGWWLALPVGIVVAALARAKPVGRPPVGAFVAVMVVLGLQGAMLAQHLGAGDARSQAARAAAAVRAVRTDLADFHSASSHLRVALDGTSEASGLDASDLEAQGIDPVRLYAMRAEAHVGLVMWARRLCDGRLGRNLPVHVQLPDDYPHPDDIVFVPGDSIAEPERALYREFYRDHLHEFLVSAAAVDSARHAAPRARRNDARIRRSMQAMAAILLSMLPDDPSGDLLALAQQAATAAGIARAIPMEDIVVELPRPDPDAARYAPLGAEPDDQPLRDPFRVSEAHLGTDDAITDDGPKTRTEQHLNAEAYPTWLSDELFGLLGTTLEAGLAEPVARIHWQAGREDRALEILTTGGTDRADRHARDLLHAEILFNRFNQLMADNEDAAARAALTTCREVLARVTGLEAAATAPRRVALDARRLEGLTHQFGLNENEKLDAVNTWDELARRNPPRRVRRDDAPDDGADASSTRATSVAIPGSGEPDARFLAGIAHLARGKTDLAVEAFADEIQRDPAHTLARFQLGQIQTTAARARHDSLISEYTPNYRALPFDRQRPEVETLPYVPIWALEEAFAANPGFTRNIEQVTNLINLAYDTDPDNPKTRALAASIYFQRGNAHRVLDQLDLAELYLRKSYTIWPGNSEDINGVRIGDMLGHFYVSVWEQVVDRDDEDTAAVVDLLSRALRISEYVRDQLYEFAREVIDRSPDWNDRRLQPFYVIAADLYPHWAPARHWLSRFHRSRALLKPEVRRELEKAQGSPVDPHEEWVDAEANLLAAAKALDKDGGEEWVTLLLEVAQFYVEWATWLQAEATAALRDEEPLQHDTPGFGGRDLAVVALKKTWRRLVRGLEFTLDHIRFAGSPDLGWQTRAIIFHELDRVASMIGHPRLKLLEEAIRGYQDFLTEKGNDANNAVLSSLMARRVHRLRGTGATAEEILAAIDAYVQWTADPSPLVTDMRERVHADELWQAIQPLIGAGQTEQATAKLAEALARYPRHSAMQLAMARLHEDAGDVTSAIAHYRLASAASPPSLLALYHAARLLRGVDGRLPEAAAFLRDFIEEADYHLASETPDDVKTDESLQELFQARAEARDIMREVQARADQLWAEGMAARDADDNATARAKLEQSIALVRGDAERHCTLGEVCEALSDYDAAESQYVVAAGANHLRALGNLAILWARDVPRAGAAMEALREFATAIDARLDAGEHVDVRVRALARLAASTEQQLMADALEAGTRGLQAVDAGDYEAAVPHLEQLLYTNPGCIARTHGYEPLLLALDELGRQDECIVWALRGIEFDRDDARRPHYHFVLARSLLACSHAAAVTPGVPELAPFGRAQELQVQWAEQELRGIIERWPDTQAAARARAVLQARGQD